MMPPKESVKGLKRSKVMHKSQIGNGNKKGQKVRSLFSRCFIDRPLPKEVIVVMLLVLPFKFNATRISRPTAS